MSKGEETRERIVAKAAALFNQRGLEGTSLADLMEATGLEKEESIGTFRARRR
jgi:TetR/AcrR family transcriptional repressor of nem operon